MGGGRWHKPRGGEALLPPCPLSSQLQPTSPCRAASAVLRPPGVLRSPAPDAHRPRYQSRLCPLQAQPAITAGRACHRQTQRCPEELGVSWRRRHVYELGGTWEGSRWPRVGSNGLGCWKISRSLFGGESWGGVFVPYGGSSLCHHGVRKVNLAPLRVMWCLVLCPFSDEEER